MKKNETKAYFNFRNFDCEPDYITEKLGIEPRTAGVAGDPHPVGAGKTIPLRESLWSLQSPIEVHNPVEEHVQALLDLLEKRAEPLKEFTNKYESTLYIAIYYYEVNPAICLDKDLIKRIADLHIDIDFDIFCLGEV